MTARKRSQNQLRRILLMIDAMAGFAFPKTTQEILEHLEEHTGSKHGYRTVERDLWLLESMGLVSFNGRLQEETDRGGGPFTFKINLKPTERLQAAAMKLIDDEAQ